MAWSSGRYLAVGLLLLVAGCKTSHDANFDGPCPTSIPVTVLNADNGTGVVNVNGISVNCPAGSGHTPAACGEIGLPSQTVRVTIQMAANSGSYVASLPSPCSQGGQTADGPLGSCTFPDPGVAAIHPITPGTLVVSFGTKPH